ncbi:hypothetical protein Smed_4119 (plasmid) [Sinorhizobium medicae WSM419]|uniref:Uncharacterized protein n=1 Tax=Sinorhizobium medicae (strain WSM419) TaxID=366394 RepID=A6UGZ5_SINMW|nr:hypothetical protein Smed_4119 [Sinorhizobium medicae WSM419]
MLQSRPQIPPDRLNAPSVVAGTPFVRECQAAAQRCGRRCMGEPQRLFNAPAFMDAGEHPGSEGVVGPVLLFGNGDGQQNHAFPSRVTAMAKAGQCTALM